MKRTVQLLVTCVVLAAVLARTPLNEIGAAIRGLHPGFLLLAILLQVGVRVLAARRTALLTRSQEIDLTTFQVLMIGLASQFYSLSPLGGAAGAAVRLRRFSRGGSAYDRSFAILVADRVVDLAGLVVVGVVLWLVDTRRFGGEYVSVPAAATILVAAGVLAVLGLRRSWASAPAANIDGSSTNRRVAAESTEPNDNGNVVTRVRRVVLRFLSALLRFRDLSQKDRWSLVGLTLVKDALGVLTYVAIAASLGLWLTLPTLGWLRSLVAILAVLPVAFRGLGVREAGLVLLLAPYGVSSAEAVAFSVVIFAITLTFGLLGALSELTRFRATECHKPVRSPESAASPVRSTTGVQQ